MPAPARRPRRPRRPARRESAPTDPLTLFARSAPAAGRRAGMQPLASGEHVWLGNAAATEAARRLRSEGLDVADAVFARVRRLSGEESFAYGELVALSGDFYGSPSELYEEQPSPLPWLWEGNDLSDLGELFEAEVRWIDERQRGRGARAYPTASVRLAWNAKSYLELALRNADHFGWHSLLAYLRHHRAALELARRAAGREGELWSRALVYNAFADHFLCDGFAAGHIRVPRAEILSWAEARGHSVCLAGALSKLLHDQDGHVETLHGAEDEGREAGEGLAVCNARGDAWRTYCDGQLFLFPGATTRPEVRLPVEALAASIVELVTAWKTGALPEGLYAATSLVPFPDPRAPGLADKFSPRLGARGLERLHRQTAWYAKIPWLGPGLTRAHLRELFAELPALMGRLRARVAEDLSRDPELRRRVAPGFLEGFGRIR